MGKNSCKSKGRVLRVGYAVNNINGIFLLGLFFGQPVVASGGMWEFVGVSGTFATCLATPAICLANATRKQYCKIRKFACTRFFALDFLQPPLHEFFCA